MHSRDIINGLLADGWFAVSQEGSHRHYKHAAKDGKVTVPHPKKDVPIKTIRSIERQAGVRLRKMP
jgi:predicted RNA binding protein YcfA (HicA-like mRNA interferase family)